MKRHTGGLHTSPPPRRWAFFFPALPAAVVRSHVKKNWQPANYRQGIRCQLRERVVNAARLSTPPFLQHASTEHVFKSPSSLLVNIALFVWTEPLVWATQAWHDCEWPSRIHPPENNVYPVRWMVLIMKQSVTRGARFMAKPCKHPAIYQTTLRICLASHRCPNRSFILFIWKRISDLLWWLNYRHICLYPQAVIDYFVKLFPRGTFGNMAMLFCSTMKYIYLTSSFWIL